MWIGLNDITTNAAYQWADGTNLTASGYTNWDSGQPLQPSGGVAYCVYQSTGGLWTSDSCTDNTIRALCRWNASSSAAAAAAAASIPVHGECCKPMFFIVLLSPMVIGLHLTRIRSARTDWKLPAGILIHLRQVLLRHLRSVLHLVSSCYCLPTAGRLPRHCRQ